MKHVILSADGTRKVWLVSDDVADDLREHCLAFLDWMHGEPQVKKFRRGSGFCYDESDFVEYLAAVVCPDEKPRFVCELADGKDGARYADCPSFNF